MLGGVAFEDDDGQLEWAGDVDADNDGDDDEREAEGNDDERSVVRKNDYTSSVNTQLKKQTLKLKNSGQIKVKGSQLDAANHRFFGEGGDDDLDEEKLKGGMTELEAVTMEMQAAAADDEDAAAKLNMSNASSTEVVEVDQGTRISHLESIQRRLDHTRELDRDAQRQRTRDRFVKKRDRRRARE